MSYYQLSVFIAFLVGIVCGGVTTWEQSRPLRRQRIMYRVKFKTKEPPYYYRTIDSYTGTPSWTSTPENAVLFGARVHANAFALDEFEHCEIEEV